MSVRLKIKFSGSKNEIKPFWVPVAFELQPKKATKPIRILVKDFEKDIKDEPLKRSCYFEIPNLPRGVYAFRVHDLYTGFPIIQELNLELKAPEVEYVFKPRFRPRFAPKAMKQPGPIVLKQPNTYAMDLTVDAPYRIEGTYPYLPIIVYIKDITPGEVRVKSIGFEIYSQPGGFTSLPPEWIYQVLDSDGTQLEKDGQPFLLRLDPGKDYETATTDPWYRIILLHKDKLKPLEGDYLGYKNVRYLQYQVKVTYRKLFEYKKQFAFRTLLPEFDLPCMEDWHYGDTHYHSDFTDNPYEYGGPLPMTAEAAKAVGFSWVTVTDHSYCLSHCKTPEEEEQGNRWLSYKKAVRETNERYKEILLVAAEEVTARRYISGLHLLSFRNPFIEDKHLMGFGSLTMQEVFEKIKESPGDNKGFLFAAHPASEGYVWKDSDYKTASDPEFGDLFVGLQVFNEKILYKRISQLSTESYVVDPFALFDENDRQRPWSKELQEGIRDHWVKRFLLPSLRQYRQKGNLKKCFILAGSDAHMDFNYALRPHPAFLLHYLNDNAFGKVRTLAYLPKQNGQSLTEQGLYDALRTGKTLLTDGPVALFYARPEGDSRVYRFGDTVTLPPGKNLEVFLEWRSTPEFGPIERMEMYLGTTKGEKKISDQIDFSKSRQSNFGLQGQLKHIFPSWTESPCYLRLEADTMIDPEADEGLFRCITNPIWIIAEQ
jgi:hypothetical protein